VIYRECDSDDEDFETVLLLQGLVQASKEQGTKPATAQSSEPLPPLSPLQLELRGICRLGDKEALKTFLANNPEINLDFKDPSGGSTLLTEVSIKTAQFTEIVSLLLDAGADLDIVDSLGNTPLHNAVLYWPSTQQTVDLLLARGADVTLKNYVGATPFNLAEDKELKHVLMELKKKKTQRLLSKRTRSKQKGYKDSPNLRKIVCEQVKPGKSSKVIVKFNGKVQSNRPGVLKRKRSETEEDENGDRSSKKIRFNNVVDSSEGVLEESLNNDDDDESGKNGKQKPKKSKKQKLVSGILNNMVNSMFKKKRT